MHKYMIYMVRLFKVSVQKILMFTISGLITIHNINSAYILEQGFLVTSKIRKFEKSIDNKKCLAQIIYPHLSSENPEIYSAINNDIKSFVNSYNLCALNINIDKSGNNSNYYNKRFTTSYYTPSSNSLTNFSVIWHSKNGDKIIRTDSLNFNTISAELINYKNILIPTSEALIENLITLAGDDYEIEKKVGSLLSEQFDEKVRNREIQFFLENGKWYIVYNTKQGKNYKSIIKEIPGYLLKNNDNKNEQHLLK
ncbi:MAG TPA: hypothetical protein QKA14_01080 [Candidatus Megaira endosymbiont of Hartmannula sinica]|nr:hypothetical protein [Candidatus Megaera endosymbiont of Hartmannula sinica]